jgi:hypothetical protein
VGIAAGIIKKNSIWLARVFKEVERGRMDVGRLIVRLKRPI